jgi:hypothetical protein
MAIFERDFLLRLKSRGAPAKSQETVSQSENGENGTEQQNSGALVAGAPKHSSSKGSWRDDARILEELYPEEFGPPRDQPISTNTELGSPTLTPQCPPIVPESPQGRAAGRLV